MADMEQLKILKQDVEAWNTWRAENFEVNIDLRMADLRMADLRMADLGGGYMSGVNLSGANLSGANLSGADLFGGKLLKADLSGTNLSEANLSHADMTEANLVGAHLDRANLTKTNLNLADMTEVRLIETKLIKTDFSHARLTGVYLYGASRDEWTIDGVICDFVYWEDDRPFYWEKGHLDINEEKIKQWEQEHRVPKNRNFKPGEFEELYKQLPTFEYYFDQGFTPLDPLIMDRVVQAINERQPEIELKLATFDARGEAHATFTVLHKDNVEEALKQVTVGYETRLKVVEGQKKQLMQVIAMLGSGNAMLQATNDGFNIKHTIPSELTQQIIEFLVSLPGINSEDARQGWILTAGLDTLLHQQIQFRGASLHFVQLLVQTVLGYGTLSTGKHAIVAVLEAAKNFIGQDKQVRCDELICDIQKYLKEKF